jgi:RHO1 GDP-GTP exchange protein 1/2
MFIRPLRNTDPPIIPLDRLDSFIHDVFHNFAELHAHHRRLVDQFHDIQREEHPTIRSVTAVLFDATLNFREAYMEYIPNYPIAAYRVDDEIANNPAFKAFVEVFMLSFICWMEFSTFMDSIVYGIPMLIVMT